jgi:hypothetical protein
MSGRCGTRRLPPPTSGKFCEVPGALAQLAEHRLCKAGVRGSSPLGSTRTLNPFGVGRRDFCCPMGTSGGSSARPGPGRAGADGGGKLRPWLTTRAGNALAGVKALARDALTGGSSRRGSMRSGGGAMGNGGRNRGRGWRSRGLVGWWRLIYWRRAAADGVEFDGWGPAGGVWAPDGGRACGLLVGCAGVDANAWSGGGGGGLCLVLAGSGAG